MCTVTAGIGRTWAAIGLFAIAVVECGFGLVGALLTGMSFAALRDTFMIPNASIGIGCAACGVLIACRRPGNRLGWLLLGAGVMQLGTVGVSPWLLQALQDGAPDATVRTLSTVYSGLWPWSVSLFIPLVLLHFPDGRLPGRRWRAVVPLIVGNAVLQVALFGADPNPLSPVRELGPQALGRGLPWIAIHGINAEPVSTASDLVLAAAYVAGLVGLAVRYRRGTERTRRQLLWLLLAVTVAIVIILTSRLGGPIDQTGYPILLMAFIGLVPVAVAIAVLRYQLLDIRLVWSRTVTYALLTAAVVAVYLLVVELVDRLLRQQIGIGASVLATLLVAAGFNPVRVRLQRQVDRLLYGERADPVRAASSVAAHLAAGAERPADVLPALCLALRLPYAALSDLNGVVGEHGVRPEHVELIPLRHSGQQVGELQIGVRTGQWRLDVADRAVLELMAVPIGVALHAGALSVVVQRSRQEIVAAREEERRRLRRDLHDGLGPALTGIAFQADAVVNLAATDPPQVRALGENIRAGVTGAIADVRRLIYQLRPAALDDLGLVEALRRHAQRLDRRSDGALLQVDVHADGELPELPAAVEVAAYRIVTEALTNVTRHSLATRADVDVSDDHGALLLTVRDDGRPTNGSRWEPGVGLLSMVERAAELGGTVSAEPTPEGGRVEARLPLEPGR